MPAAPALRLWLFVAATVLLYVAIPIHFERVGLYGVSGDEPHYIINGLSIARDGDLNLDNNYREWTAFEIAPMFPHAYQTASRWYPFRGIGVPLLVAWPADWFGPLGARVALAALIALLTVPAFRVLRQLLQSDDWALGIALGFFWALPYLVSAGLVFPDMLTGALTFAAVAALVQRRDAQWSLQGRVGFALASAAIVLVYWRHLPVLAVLAGAMLVQSIALHGLPLRRAERWSAVLKRPSLRADLVLLATLALAALATIIWILVNGLLTRGDGFFQIAPLGRAVETFIGHHLDQNHGILWRNPLLWLALPGWVLMWRQQRALLLLILALYAVLFLPQCATDMLYGAYGIGGRYSWNFIWLWLFPLCASVQSLRQRAWSRELLGISIALGIGYQIVLASRWLEPYWGDQLVRDNVQAGLGFVNNVFGEARWTLPAFNFGADSFRNPVNLWFMALTLLALAAAPLAPLLRGTAMRATAFALVLLITASVAALGLQRRYDLETISLEVRALKRNADRGYVGYGIVWQLPPGRFRAEYSVEAVQGGAAWDVLVSRGGQAERIAAGMLPVSGPKTLPATLDFTVAKGDTWPAVNFNVWSEGDGPVTLHAVTLTRFGPALP